MNTIKLLAVTVRIYHVFIKSKHFNAQAGCIVVVTIYAAARC